MSTRSGAESAAAAPSSEWDYASIGEISQALQSRKLSASELLQHTIARIEALDKRLNSIVARTFDLASDAAKAADAALARGERKPLLGIPVTLKEPFNLVGSPSTWGFPQFGDFMPTEDALVISRLKQAGAVIIGKTNIPVGLRDFQSYNYVYGMTCNRWDLGRSPGGSSGGSAASLAAGAASRYRWQGLFLFRCLLHLGGSCVHFRTAIDRDCDRPLAGRLADRGTGDRTLSRGRTTIAFAELVAREFDGFVPPPMSSL
jgi:Amidase